MCHDDRTGGTGRRTSFVPYETRRIVIAEGVDCQESDMDERNRWKNRAISELNADPSVFHKTDNDLHRRLGRYVRYYGWHRRRWSDERIAQRLIRKIQKSMAFSDFQYLERKLGADFRVSDRQNAEYVSNQQRVRYVLQVIYKKSEFKTALETDGIIVIYSGHSRYGRGACFDQYSGSAKSHGEQWGNGSDNDEGLFLLGYSYVPVALKDIEHHHYRCAPVAIEDGAPPRQRRHPYDRHPSARRRLRRIELPEELRGYVLPGYASVSHIYYGYKRRGETNVLLNAGWTATQVSPYDLGVTNMRCKTFCHFGCSSRLHYWHIVRRSDYKAYQRTSPPTDKFAYFTTAPSDHRTAYWIHYLLAYPVLNNSSHWWDSHEYAKRRANTQLRRERAGFQFY